MSLPNRVFALLHSIYGYGACLAERVRHTSGWRQFTLYRVAPEAGPVTVTFVLTGFGEAAIDDVSIEVLPADRRD